MASLYELFIKKFQRIPTEAELKDPLIIDQLVPSIQEVQNQQWKETKSEWDRSKEGKTAPQARHEEILDHRLREATGVTNNSQTTSEAKG